MGTKVLAWEDLCKTIILKSLSSTTLIALVKFTWPESIPPKSKVVIDTESRQRGKEARFDRFISNATINFPGLKFGYTIFSKYIIYKNLPSHIHAYSMVTLRMDILPSISTASYKLTLNLHKLAWMITSLALIAFQRTLQLQLAVMLSSHTHHFL